MKFQVSFSPSQILAPTRPTSGGRQENSGGGGGQRRQRRDDSDQMVFELDAVKASLLSFRHLFELENSQVDTVMPSLDTNT